MLGIDAEGGGSIFIFLFFLFKQHLYPFGFITHSHDILEAFGLINFKEQ